MAKLLIKVAKELNVGVATLVDYLNNNGFEIDNRPTAKVTEEMEGALAKEFQKIAAIKDKADQMKKRTVTINSPLTPAASEQDKAEINIFDLTNNDNTSVGSNSPKIEPQILKKEEGNILERTNVTLSKPKILGKIDLKANTNNRFGSNRQQQIENREPRPETKRQETSTALVVENETTNEENTLSKTESLPILTPPPINKAAIEEKTVAETKEAPKGTVIESQGEGKPDLIRSETPELRGLKIKGKIDIDKFSRKPKKREETPANRSSQAPRTEGSGNPDRRRDGQAPRTEGSGNPDRRRDGQAPRMEGGGNPDRRRDGQAPRPDRQDNRNRPPRPEIPRTPEQQAEDDRRKKRPRKRQPLTTGTGEGNQNRTDSPTSGNANRPNQPNTNRPNNNTDGQNRNSNNNRDNNNRPPRGNDGGVRSNDNRGVVRDNRGGNFRDNRGVNKPAANASTDSRDTQDLLKKEIDEKIRATMARLSGGGKKKRQKIRRENRERQREKQDIIDQEGQTDKIQVTEFISVSELASLLDVGATDVIMTCMNLGVIVSINQRMDAEIIELVAEEYGKEVEFVSAEEASDEIEEEEENVEDLLPRAPIVTVMGHVDHGKTSLLDYIRSANVAGGEAGGITQHIGAYEVKVGAENKKITFLDTPGHEAFTAMRARGAKVTDIAIIVIAADDNIMPQTKEAISHAQAANVPLIFAINKVDKEGANPEKIKESLAGMNLLVEDWGGKYQSQDISAKTGLGIEELLEKVLLEAEVLELKANPNRKGVGVILEASLDKGRGYVTKALVEKGTLSIGAPIVAGEYSGKIKAMFNEYGQRIKKAYPAQPVLILGLNGAPQAGERFKEVESESEARQIASKRGQINREQANRASKRISLDEIGRRLALGNFKELNLIVKGDFDGSIEALTDSLIKQSVESIQVNVIHKAVGQIIESDVLLASASDAIIIGFQVRPSLGARKLAEREGVQIKTYSIIYEAIDEIRSAMEGMLEPTKEERFVGNVEVREVFKISKVGTIAGCYVQEGKILRTSFVRVVRDGIVIFPNKEGANGEIASLKRFKEDVKEVKAGFECGIDIKNFNDIKEGDIIEAYEIVEVKQTLD